jgi:hypothetical protein
MADRAKNSVCLGRAVLLATYRANLRTTEDLALTATAQVHDHVIMGRRCRAHYRAQTRYGPGRAACGFLLLGWRMARRWQSGPQRKWNMSAPSLEVEYLARVLHNGRPIVLCQARHLLATGMHVTDLLRYATIWRSFFQNCD